MNDVKWPRVGRPDDLATIVDWTAAELSAAIRDRVVSCVEVMTAYLDRIDALNPRVNAIVALRPRDELLAEAAAKDALLDAGTHEGWMHGFPHAVKDLSDVAGLPTTKGFLRAPLTVPVADTDTLFVERLRAAGAIFIGKTNTPELGLGSHTYNPVYGVTLNPYDLARTAGGSSGGAAVAVALKMVPVADGSDFMGSLRNPPGWTNVYGMRPSVGRVPAAGGEVFLSQGSVDGPIARNPLDLALLLETMSGYDDRWPLAIHAEPGSLLDVDADVTGRRVLWLRDLGGYLPMEPEVLEVCDAAVEDLRSMGVQVDVADELPSFGLFRGNEDLWQLWLTHRHFLSGGVNKPLYDDPVAREMLKPEAIYEIEGLILGHDGAGPMTAETAFAASKVRSDMYQAFRVLFETYDHVLLPTAQVMPFGIDTTWPAEIAGHPMSSYHRWMEVSTVGTLLGGPTIAMPAGFGSGLPIGLQVIGRNHDEVGVIQFAQAWENHAGWATRMPPTLDAAD